MKRDARDMRAMHGERERRDERDGGGFEVRSSRFSELRTLNFGSRLSRLSRSSRLSRAAILLGGWGRLHCSVGRQLRAAQVGGEQRLNLAAQFGLNLIRRFSGIDHFEVKLFRHFVEFLDQQ